MAFLARHLYSGRMWLQVGNAELVEKAVDFLTLINANFPLINANWIPVVRQFWIVFRRNDVQMKDIQNQ